MNSNETQNDAIKRQIRTDLTACVYALDNGPDIDNYEEKHDIFIQMQRCTEILLNLSKQLKCTNNSPAIAGAVDAPVAAVEKKKKTMLQDDEVNDYLKSHITDEHCYKMLITTPIDEVGADLNDIANRLKNTNNRADGAILQTYYILGSQLNCAKEKFNKNRTTEGFTQKWSEWVSENVGLSTSHCYKIMTVAKLLSVYPKLLNLKGVSFTELYNLRKIIISNEDIAKDWSTDLCLLCEELPAVTALSLGFTSCKHGVHYCKSCITKLMEDREVECEVTHSRRNIEQWNEPIETKRCPECRKDIVLA
jgi:hypothetical protein